MDTTLLISLDPSDHSGVPCFSFTKGETVRVVAGNGMGRYKVQAGERFAWVHAESLAGDASQFPQTPMGY